ncbi:mig-23 [Pristionchus pacificus]|uniref:Mig-23 n=1 Tax=Pristionchus pacificus TaxID=54126 RepID=A0A2A6BCT2_PRIPA|nr:mig-23 [Pristionchus pacificus]|eukprot:PDM63641.1 mig-23 [Pristionchus pacificus]
MFQSACHHRRRQCSFFSFFFIFTGLIFAVVSRLFATLPSSPLLPNMVIRLSARSVLLLILMIVFLILYLIVEITGANSQLSIVAGIAPDDEVSYGIIIDAGSTGSRLFLYNWRATSVDELIDIKPTLDEHNNPVVRKVFPGLSTFADKPDHAADYIKPLLDYAIQYVPPANRPYTPVFILATAGMRLVPIEQQKAILSNLHTRLPKLTEMQIMKEHIRVIEGKWEGIYSWIAVNYILGKFASSHSKPLTSSTTLSDVAVSTPSPAPVPRQPAVGMIDMGGASVQIAFEMPQNETFRSENVENVFHVALSGQRSNLVVCCSCAIHEQYDQIRIRIYSIAIEGTAMVKDPLTGNDDLSPGIAILERSGSSPRRSNLKEEVAVAYCALKKDREILTSESMTESLLAYELKDRVLTGSDSGLLGQDQMKLNLGCKDDDPTFKYQLYVTTFLGYGVNEGLRRYEQSLSDSLENGTLSRDSCLPINLQKEVIRADGSKFMRKGTGDWIDCTARLTDIVTNAKTKCADSCFFGSAPAPKMSLNDVEIYGFSEYWFSVEDVLGLGGAYNYSQVAEKSKSFCSQRWSNIQNQARRKLYAKANDDRLRSQCFKSAWVNAVLHGGFNVSKEHNTFRSAYNIAGQEIQWALGAMIYNMRYYPLRLAQRKKLQEESAHFHRPVSSIQVTQLFAVLVLIGAIAYVTYLCTTRKRATSSIRRENSFWSYMMVPTEDRFKTTTNIYRSPLTPSLS